MPVLMMILSAAAIILAVRFGLLRGLDHLGGALNWSVKTRGQATGYATSVPEFVCLVAAGLAGVWEAGLWNIASSNIINGALMGAAVIRYKKVGDLFHRRFVDEIGFAAAAIVVPLLLMQAKLDRSWLVVPILLAFFVVYRVVDARVNKPVPEGAEKALQAPPVPEPVPEALPTLQGVQVTPDLPDLSSLSPVEAYLLRRVQELQATVDALTAALDGLLAVKKDIEPATGSLPAGLGFLVTGLVAIAVAGFFLGDATESVVNQLGVHPAIAGWILGFCTSLPEMVTFFAVYAAAEDAGELDGLADTQEALDNLTASNMANVGLIYPIGLAVFLLAPLVLS
jgi:Ca2+/Na+ antiporter